MPYICFSFPADVPPGTRNRNAAQAASRDLRKMPLPCLSYPFLCFSYPSDVLPGTRNRDTAKLAPPGLRRMGTSTCFRY